MGGPRPRRKTAIAKTDADAVGPPETAPASVPDTFVAAYVTSLANRLNAGASAYYRSGWGIGMSEWRTVLAIGRSTTLIARDIAALGGMDAAMASRSLRNLKRRGLVRTAPSERRGGAAVVALTAAGLELHGALRAAGQTRQDRLLADFSAADIATLWRLLRRLGERVPAMNREDRQRSSP